MKKIKFYQGGQPFRSTDFKLIQDNIFEGIRQIFSKIENSAYLIISGVETDADELDKQYIKVTSGVIFDGAEICEVSETQGSGNINNIYLRKTVTQSSPRIVGGTSKYIFEDVTYQTVITTSPLPTDIPYTQFKRVDMVTQPDYHLVLEKTIELDSGTLHIHVNKLDDVLLRCTYTHANNASNKFVYQLPEKYKPNKTVYSSYIGSNIVKPLSIAENGNLTLFGLTQGEVIELYVRYNKTIG